jgi:hypothetical protein
MDNDLIKRLMWSALLAGFGALFSMAARRTAMQLWRQLFGEDPPE